MFSHPKEKMKCEAMAMLMKKLAGMLSQCICISDHGDVHFIYLTILFVNHTSIKLKTVLKIKLDGGDCCTTL